MSVLFNMNCTHLSQNPCSQEDISLRVQQDSLWAHLPCTPAVCVGAMHRRADSGGHTTTQVAEVTVTPVIENKMKGEVKRLVLAAVCLCHHR